MPTRDQEVPADQPAADSPAASNEDRWAVLIYMAATSPPLRQLMQRELTEMTRRMHALGAGVLEVYALLDTPDGRYAIRYPLHRDGGDETLVRLDKQQDKDVEKAIGRKGAFLAKFIDWRFTPESKISFQRTLLVLWGHSQGVASALSTPGSPAYAMVGNGGFGLNDLSGDSLSLPEIRRAIAQGLLAHGTKRIDILSFDSCFMSAAEVSAEFQPNAPPDLEGEEDVEAQLSTEAEDQAETERPETNGVADPESAARVDYVVASQSAVLLDGIDYGRLVDAFVDSDHIGDVKPFVLGARLLEQACSGHKSPISLSMLRTGDDGPYSRFREALRELVNALAEVLDTSTEPPTQEARAGRSPFNPRVPFIPSQGPNRTEWLRIRDAFEGATWHRVRQFIDVADLCRRLANNCRDPKIRIAARKVLGQLQPGAHSLVQDVRSAHPLVFSGMSLYCPWLFPTPEEVSGGAWNAVVDLYDYANDLWFNRGKGSWGAFLYHAKHVLEESRQRAINVELADLRAAAARCQGEKKAPAPERDPFEALGGGGGKGGNDGFQPAEPSASHKALSPLKPELPSDLAATARTDKHVPIF